MRLAPKGEIVIGFQTKRESSGKNETHFLQTLSSPILLLTGGGSQRAELLGKDHF